MSSHFLLAGESLGDESTSCLRRSAHARPRSSSGKTTPRTAAATSPPMPKLVVSAAALGDVAVAMRAVTVCEGERGE